jgi:hypothetical protein
MRLALLVLVAMVAVTDARPPKPRPVTPASGYLTIDSQPYAVIFIDGKRYGETPLVKIALAPGRHTVRAVRDNGSAQRLTFDIERDKTVFHRVRWDNPPGPPAAPPDRGYLELYSTPSADIWIDGVDTGMTTPITGKALPLAPGRHKVSFKVADDRWTYAVVIKTGETMTLTKQLQ